MRIAMPRGVLAVATLPALLAAAGCSSSSPGSSYIAQADPTAVTGDYAPTRPVRGADLSLALASMPEPGGSQVTLREKSFPNGLRQDIVLAGDKSPFGDNILSIAIQAAPLGAGARGGVPVYPPGEAGIKSEILARYPNVDMQILTQPRRNSLGTFGLAIGRHASGVRCVFAWQYVEDVRNPGASSSSFSKLGSFGSTTQPAAIRVNMCRKDATVDDLAMAVEGLTLAPGAVIDRALEARGASASAVAVRPAGSAGVMASADGSLEGALTTSVRPTRVASAPTERRRVAHRAKKPDAEETVAQQSPVAPQMPAAPVYPTGPRYLAPVPGGPAGGPTGGTATAYAVPSYGAGYGSAPATKSLDPSLPAAAYRGPSAQR